MIETSICRAMARPAGSDSDRPTRSRQVDSGRRFPRTLLALSIGALVSFPAAAYEPTTNLGRIGQTELQQRTGDAVQIVCGQLGRMDSRNAAQDDLFDRCGNMVGNASVLVDADPPTAAAKSLGWATDSELAAVVQTVANEELAATRSMATELGSGQATVAISRLQAVRSGILFGASGNGLSLYESLADAGAPASSKDGLSGGSAGDSLVGSWGLFANVNYATGDRDETARENAFDYDTYGATVGADYRLSERTIVGGMISYENIDSDFDKNNNFASSPSGTPGGSIDADSWGIGLYGTHYHKNYYVDGLLGYASTDYDIKRNIALPLGPEPGSSPAAVSTFRTAKADTDSDSFTASVGGGMNLSAQSLSYGPFGRLSYSKTDVDGYREKGADGLNLTVKGQDWDSLTSAIGGQVSHASSQSWGVLSPYGRIAWLHEFLNDSQTMRAFYTADPNQINLIAKSDDPDRDYFQLNLGLAAVMRDGVQAFFDYQALLGHRYLSENRFTLGVRLEM
jgi:uncharacterized protein YhjY with autotransporter beta-barrel domain